MTLRYRHSQADHKAGSGQMRLQTHLVAVRQVLLVKITAPPPRLNRMTTAAVTDFLPQLGSLGTVMDQT